ncbi:hypothetical protein UA08_04974 [Talaromyces atroroseus]|uniref:Uncharacterized protein n=1 Tax=Talaromyces atroroseus TaxID=1441469 RepID=A0A225AH38_TALAT|nr:hypothetical protein UA08_04974 [Talaromyces atroroseus]OKL60050.1 hypothetical protein UA08_04974 [Talaromyces atroroseus]
MTASAPLLPRKPSDFKPVISIYNHISIAAPPLAVFSAVLNTTTWSSWNYYNPSATIYYRPPSSVPQPKPSFLDTVAESSSSFLSPGCKFTEFHCKEAEEAGVGKPQNLEIVAIEELQSQDGKNGYRIVWRLLDWSDWLMRTRRVHEFVASGNGQTEYNSWTELGGLLAWIVKWTSGDRKMKSLFEKSFEGLKVYVESEGNQVQFLDN